MSLKGNPARSGTGLEQTLFMTSATAREVVRLSNTRAERELVVPTNQTIAILQKVHRLQGVTVVIVTHTPYPSTPGALIPELAEGRVAKQSRT